MTRKEKALFLRPFIEKAVQFLSDVDGLKAKTLYPHWKDLVELGRVEAEADSFRFYHDGELYRCKNANPTFQKDWVPGLETSALYVRIDETSAGTISDPIIADRGMEYIYGLYYLDPEDNKTYLCARIGAEDGTTIQLAYLPHELIGQYFTEKSIA